MLLVADPLVLVETAWPEELEEPVAGVLTDAEAASGVGAVPA